MNALAKVNYSHEAMIDLIVGNPGISQRELARHFGYTEGWVSRVMSSDAFKAALSARRGEIVDPVLVQSVEERFEALVTRSMDIVMEKLEAHPTPDFALKSLDLGARALGYGARNGGAGVTVQQNFVVAMPETASTPKAWVEKHAPPVTIDSVVEG